MSTTNMAHLCQADDMHPYGCYGPDGKGDGNENGHPCVHCRQEINAEHNPVECALCHFTDEAWLREHGVI